VFKLPELAKGEFQGFTPETIKFLQELRINNNRDWFESNKNIYLNELYSPFQKFVTDISEYMMAIDPYFMSAPVTGKTISRIYKDARYSQGKPPYKTAMWFTFKRPIPDWKDSPAYFFEITADFYRYGMGFMCAERDTMDKFREFIDNDTDKFKKAISFYDHPKNKGKNKFELYGAAYKKIIKPDQPQSIQKWYQLRELYLMNVREFDDVLFKRSLLDLVSEGFIRLAEFYNYLWKVKESK